MKPTPLQVYQCYVAMKIHFTSDKYDYFESNGAVKAKVSTLESRNDKAFFYRVSNIFTMHECIKMFAISMAINPDTWIGEFVDIDTSKTVKRYYELEGYLEGFRTRFTRDVQQYADYLAKHNMEFHESLGSMTPVYLMDRNQISIEFVSFLNIITDFVSVGSDSLIMKRKLRSIRKLSKILDQYVSKSAMTKIVEAQLGYGIIDGFISAKEYFKPLDNHVSLSSIIDL